MPDSTGATLYGYFRSTAAYRVRIALGLKGLTATHQFVHLRKGEQTSSAYLKINPAGLVPLWIEGEFHLAQSLAIIGYLDETHPSPPLLPRDPRDLEAVAHICGYPPGESGRFADDYLRTTRRAHNTVAHLFWDD